MTKRPQLKIKPMPWSEERIDMLKGLWKDGFSCAQIARLLGGVSRCAVIGKVHRLGLPGRAVMERKPNGASGSHIPRARSSSPRRTRDRFIIVNADTGEIKDIRNLADEPAALTSRDGNHIGVAEIEAHQCRWPHGDPKQPVFHFCAHRVKQESPYCPFHSAIAWQPKQKPPGENLDIRMSAFALRAREAA